jgi:hypothetical protein
MFRELVNFAPAFILMPISGSVILASLVVAGAIANEAWRKNNDIASIEAPLSMTNLKVKNTKF